MEKSSYAMAKFSLESKEPMPKRDCGFYIKYIFLFTSLIQFLIILGLVLFMVYGNAQGGTDTHLRVLEKQLQDRFNKITILASRNMNLTRTLNATLKEKQGLQVLAQKVQRELEKCNSTQTANPITKLQDMVMIITQQKRKLDQCHVAVTLINNSCSADKAELRSQLNRSTLSKKDLEENCRKAGNTLTKTSEEQKSCQQELTTTKTVCEATEHNLGLLKQECRALRSDMSYLFQRIKNMLSPYSCSTVHEQLNWLMQRTEGFFLWQQERETKYVGKGICDMNLLQCNINCSGEKKELEKQLQDAEKQVKSGQEEKKKLLVEKEQLGKELEEKSKAAVQAGYLQEQLSLCMVSKLDTFFGLTGSQVPLGSGRSSPFVNTGSYVDVLENQGIFGNTGKINTEEIQRTVQKIIEQYTATLKNPSG
ncbi:plasmalemma vesicle-associated protein [Patagioenas fasciata]|uniref:plasmalemma vesicle-associated protein n=1 Tax=Patagioenas fasciata TaxID=372321 RepID=UPI0032E8706B